MPSLRERLSQAYNALRGRQTRNVPLPLEGQFRHFGMPPPITAGESLKAYGDNTWLAGAVDKIARELARTKFFLQIENDKGEIEVIKRHEALTTLQKPQRAQVGKSVLTGMALKLVTGYHMCLAGEAFWLLDRRRKINGSPTSVDVLFPTLMYEIIENGEIVAYKYRLPEREIELRPEDVVHFKLPNPEQWVRGQPPTQAIRYAIDTYQEADILNLSKIRNGAQTGGTLESTASVPESERRKILQEWRQAQAGARNAGKTAMLPYGLKFNKTEDSNADMQYVEGKNTNKDEILARYGVGPELLGLTESQTRANAEAAIFVFMKFGASFFIEMFADTLTNDYLPAFAGTEEMTVAFPDPVPENMEEKRLNAQAMFQNAALTPDEFRKMFGYEPLKIAGVTDVPYLDIGKIPVGSDPPLAA